MLILILASAALFAEDAAIWHSSNTQASAQAIQTALSSNGTSAQKSTSLPASLSSFDYFFICLGAYPNNFVLKAGADVDKIVAYLEAGGNVYMEGGDTWARDFPTALHGYFGAYGEADGKGDLSTLAGAGCFSDFSFQYTGAQQYMDHLAPLGGASLIFANTSPGYGAGVAYDEGSYRTIALSYEFGGLADGADTKNQLMGQILDFFDSSCTAKGPAPLNVSAFGGYHNAVPLLWDAPPGQMTLVKDQALNPTMNISSQQPDAQTWISQADSGRETALAKTGATQQANGYNLKSYNVYRRLASGGSYSKIASNVKRQYYRDTSVTNGQSYDYVVTSVYANGESGYSVATTATPAAGGYKVTSPWRNTYPNIDGYIDEEEWREATVFDVRKPGQSAPVYFYVVNNNDYLSIAIDDQANTGVALDDQVGIYIDADRNFEWASSGAQIEGNYWFYSNGETSYDLYRALSGWWPGALDWGDPTSGPKASGAVSSAAGHVQYEIQYNFEDLDISLPVTIPVNFFVYSLDMPDSVYRAAWPAAVMTSSWSNSWQAPVLYGTVELSPEPACQVQADAEVFDQAGLFAFNEGGDGHTVELNVTALNGAAGATVSQCNCIYANLPGKNPLQVYWTIEAESAADFSADYIFHYTNADASGFEESPAYWGVAWLNEAANTWNWLGGDIDVDANTVTVPGINKTGVFVLYRRIFGDITGDGYVDLDDFQLLGDAWNHTTDTEFPTDSPERFFNYGLSVDDAGNQVVDLDDFQIFGDVWNSGIEP